MTKLRWCLVAKCASACQSFSRSAMIKYISLLELLRNKSHWRWLYVDCSSKNSRKTRGLNTLQRNDDICCTQLDNVVLPEDSRQSVFWLIVNSKSDIIQCQGMISIYFQIWLLKIIKGTHVRNGIAGLPYIFHFMHDACLIGWCLSYRMISMVKTMLLGVGAHPHPCMMFGW